MFKINFDNDPFIKSHKNWSIFNTIFTICCCQLGLLCAMPALILSLRVRDNLKNGNIIGATKNSKTSKTLNILATTGLVIVFLINLVILVKYFEIVNQTS